jgi:hypothetical protein
MKHVVAAITLSLVAIAFSLLLIPPGSLPDFF